MGKELERYFSNQDIRIANNPIEGGSTSLIIMETHIKTIERRHFTPSRMAVISSTRPRADNNVENWNSYRLLGCTVGATTMENRSSSKNKN